MALLNNLVVKVSNLEESTSGKDSLVFLVIDDSKSKQISGKTIANYITTNYTNSAIDNKISNIKTSLTTLSRNINDLSSIVTYETTKTENKLKECEDLLNTLQKQTSNIYSYIDTQDKKVIDLLLNEIQTQVTNIYNIINNLNLNKFDIQISSLNTKISLLDYNFSLLNTNVLISVSNILNNVNDQKQITDNLSLSVNLLKNTDLEHFSYISSLSSKISSLNTKITDNLHNISNLCTDIQFLSSCISSQTINMDILSNTFDHKLSSISTDIENQMVNICSDISCISSLLCSNISSIDSLQYDVANISGDVNLLDIRLYGLRIISNETEIVLSTGDIYDISAYTLSAVSSLNDVRTEISNELTDTLTSINLNLALTKTLISNDLSNTKDDIVTYVDTTIDNLCSEVSFLRNDHIILSVHNTSIGLISANSTIEESFNIDKQENNLRPISITNVIAYDMNKSTLDASVILIKNRYICQIDSKDTAKITVINKTDNDVYVLFDLTLFYLYV